MVPIRHIQSQTTTVDTQLLYKLLEFSESLLRGDYSKRIHADFEDDVITKVADNLNRFADKLQFDPNRPDQDHARTIETFIEVISSFTNLDFEQKLPISDNGTIFDAIATGINMLGDELASSTASKQELEEERNRLNEAQAIANVGSWELSIPLFIMSLSKESRKIFELEAEGSHTFNTLKSKIHPDDLMQLEALMQKAIEERTDFSMECRMVTRDGSVKYIMCIGEVVVDNNAIALKGAFQDITERKHVEENLKEAKRLAEEANTAKSRFLANMSHEIRTPLNGILGLAQIMLSDVVNKEHRKYLEMIHSSGKNLSQLINDILDFSKIESGKLELDNLQINFRKVIDSEIERYKFLAAQKGIALHCLVDETVPQIVLADQARISQIITNIVGNSIKFTDEGAISVTFSLKQNKGDKVVIQGVVKDTGIGIPKDAQDRIFQTFSQADNSVTRKYGGTGLGLSIVKSLVELMNGTISFQSPADPESNRGSVFTFTIELKVPDQAVASIPVKKEAGSLRKAVRVLIVDDNTVNLLVARKMSEKFGAHVTTAVSGMAAIDLVKAKEFDIVLMDIQMPDFDGHETTRQLRKLKFTRPIVALSASAYQEDIQKSLVSGMNDHLQKPFTESELFRVISSVDV
jgi:PAS domain S-box-containing protein